MSLATHSESPVVSERRKIRTILIVDDEESLLSSLNDVLSMSCEDCDILTAATAEQALEVIERKPVDLLITDLKLPKMDGLELTTRLKGRSPDTRSILITAFGNEAISQTAKRLGCLAYLEKPFDVDVLLHYISLALEEQENSDDSLSLSEFLSLYTKGERSVTLSIVSPRATGTVVVEKGIIRHARYGRESGMKALELMLSEEQPIVQPVDIATPAENTLSLSYKGLQAILDPTEDIDDLSLSSESSAKSVSNHRSFDPKRFEQQMENIAFESYFEELDLEQQVLQLVNEGIVSFRARKLAQARACWEEALRVKPDCEEAQNNLNVLMMVEKLRQKH